MPSTSSPLRGLFALTLSTALAISSATAPAHADTAPPAGDGHQPWQLIIDPPTTPLAQNPLSAETIKHLGRVPTLRTFTPISVGFDSPADIADWKFLERTHWYNDKLRLSKDYAPLTDGVIDIQTRRHCLEDGQNPTADNATDGVCPTGTKTVYTSARMETPLIDKGNMRIQIRAKNTNPVFPPGIRPSLWAQSESPYCHHDYTSRYSELDLVEYFSAYPDKQHSNIHIGCVAHGHRPQMQARNQVWDEPLLNEWHTWGVEVFDNQVVFTLDGKVVDRPVVADDFSWVSPRIYSQSLDQPYRLILDTFLEPEGTKWIAGVKDSKPFGENHLLIDEILVEHEVDEGGDIVQPPRLSGIMPQEFIPGAELDQLGSTPSAGSSKAQRSATSSDAGSANGGSSAPAGGSASGSSGGAIAVALAAGLGLLAAVGGAAWAVASVLGIPGVPAMPMDQALKAKIHDLLEERGF